MNAEFFVTQIEAFYEAKYNQIQKSFMIAALKKHSPEWLVEFYKSGILFTKHTKTIGNPLPLLNVLEDAEKNFVFYPKAPIAIEDKKSEVSADEIEEFFKKWRICVQRKKMC